MSAFCTKRKEPEIHPVPALLIVLVAFSVPSVCQCTFSKVYADFGWILISFLL
jgi:hypothetical protein